MAVNGEKINNCKGYVMVKSCNWLIYGFSCLGEIICIQYLMDRVSRIVYAPELLN